MPASFSLPIHSNEFGQLPVHAFLDPGPDGIQPHPNSFTEQVPPPEDEWLQDAYDSFPSSSDTNVIPTTDREGLAATTPEVTISISPSMSYDPISAASSVHPAVRLSHPPTANYQQYTLSQPHEQHMDQPPGHSLLSSMTSTVPESGASFSAVLSGQGSEFMPNGFGSDTFGMWTNAPAGFRLV